MEVQLLDELLIFIRTLDKQTIAKSIHLIELLQHFGPQLRMPHSKLISQNLYELRIFYTFRSKTIFLLHGIIKKQQKTPKRELNKAIKLKNKLADL